MNKEKQRIAIAVACGYKIVDSPKTAGFVRLQKPDGSPVCSVGEESRDNLWPSALSWNWIPDYLNSLDAVHEAVETLRHKDGPEWFDFQKHLMDICGSTMNCIQATAAQRAEAFLKTLGLWEEG